MNEWLKLGSEAGRSNVELWVVQPPGRQTIQSRFAAGSGPR